MVLILMVLEILPLLTGGTARNITIGNGDNATKSVNGSAAVVWTLADMGAAEAWSYS